MIRTLIIILSLAFFVVASNAQPLWQSSLDSEIKFYQTTDFGIIVAGTENSLYALDGRTGERLWRRKHKGLDETSITPVPATDVILVSSDLGDKSRVEAVDLLSGSSLWRSDKVKGDVLQLAVDPANDLLATVLVKKAKGRPGQEFKRSPVVHVFRLSDGEELWKKELESDVQLMPSGFDPEGEVAYTLDNYRAPLILDGRLYLFYEGVTSYDARTGSEGEREKFKINEGGLALTEADPVFDENYLYTSGKGKIRAINRRTYKVEWEAKDLGVTPEMAVLGGVLYVRTGGRFTRIRDGEIEEKGPFGVSAIDTKTGKTLWRYKGADKGLTNFVFPNSNSIIIADKNELIVIDARTGKKIDEFDHDIEKAQFVLINESGQAVVGGQDQIAAFGFRIADCGLRNNGMRNADFGLRNIDCGTTRTDHSAGINAISPSQLSFIPQSAIPNPQSTGQKSVWRVKHRAPSRGLLKIVAGIALRATAIYFRYGGLATSALNIARGVNTARSLLSLRWSGLRTNFSSFDLTTLASNQARNYVTSQISVFGIASRTPGFMNRISGLQVVVPSASSIRGNVTGAVVRRVTPSREDLQESIFDRIDPVRQIEKLGDYFLRRKRLADLRGNYMYFYTDLPKPFDRKGLVGVNVHTGRDARFILVSDPDRRFTTDETQSLLYSADGRKLQAFDMLER